MADNDIEQKILEFKRTIKVKERDETQFFQTSVEHHQAFMETDLKRSGLTPEDIFAVVANIHMVEGALAGYVIPYHDLNGRPLVNQDGLATMFRTRYQMPEFVKGSRYLQPPAEQLAKYGLPPYVPYILPKTLELESEVMVCAEGEKKTAAIIKGLGIPAFGIGGCQMWRDPIGNRNIHPWIRELLHKRGMRKVLIVPDADLLRYDICNAYGTFAHYLQDEGYSVEIVNPPGKIDDLIVEWGSNAKQNFGALPKISLEELVQSPASLAKRYNLAFKQNDKGLVTVHQHSSNVMKLMEEHDAFPHLWRNLDNNRVMVGDAIATPDLTEMEIANYFQHNLGFDKVNHRQIFSCVQALAKKHARSPMLDYIKRQSWDGTPRLDDWVVRLWGVQDSPFARECSSKFLISACARMDKPGVKIDWMLIVVGPQGTGKTSMPNLLFKGNSLTLYGDSNDKDLHMKIHSALCIGFDELDSFGKKESSFLKAMITTSQDHFRPPYSASVDIFDRRCVLYGCGNRTEFLVSDPTGYRRYAILRVRTVLDFKQMENELPQLWAEAWLRYKEGRSDYWQINGASEEAEKHTIPSIWEERVQSAIDYWMSSRVADMVKDGKLWFTMGQLITQLQLGPQTAMNPSVTRDIAAVLISLGADNYDGKKRRGPDKGTPKKWYTIDLG